MLLVWIEALVEQIQSRLVGVTRLGVRATISSFDI